jgi:hypothetical protein
VTDRQLEQEAERILHLIRRAAAPA